MLDTLELSSTEARLRNIVAGILQIDPYNPALTHDANLFLLGLESLNVIELLTQIEIDFDMTIDVEDLSGAMFEHFGTLIGFVEARTGVAQ